MKGGKQMTHNIRSLGCKKVQTSKMGFQAKRSMEPHCSRRFWRKTLSVRQVVTEGMCVLCGDTHLEMERMKGYGSDPRNSRWKRTHGGKESE